MSFLAVHIAVGLAALLLYWSALLSRKGGPRHRRNGRRFLWVLIAVALSVGPLIIGNASDPGRVIQFLYLDLCLLTVGWVGWRAIRHRRDLAAFRSRPFAFLGWALAGSGALVLAAGVATSDIMAMFFSWIGLAFGAAMIAFARHAGPLHPNWGLGWHLNAMTLLFNAVHGTLAFVLWRRLVDAQADIPEQLAFQLLTLAIALALRLHYGRRHAAPLSFAAPAPGTTTATTRP